MSRSCEQQAAALHVAPGLLHERHQGAVETAAQEAHRRRILPARRPRRARFTDFSRLDHDFATATGAAGASVCDSWRHLPTAADTLYAGELEIRPREGLVLASGRALTLSVREFELLAAMARRQGAIITREELYGTVWGGELRPGDRSVDVYVSKLRGKLEAGAARPALHPHPPGLRLPLPARASRKTLAARARPRGRHWRPPSAMNRTSFHEIVHIRVPGR